MRMFDLEITQPLASLLKEIETAIYGFNYEITLKADLVTLKTQVNPLNILKVAYPSFDAKSEELKLTSVEDMRAAIDERILYEGDEHSYPNRKNSSLVKKLVAELWITLGQTIDLKKSEIYCYGGYDALSGDFAYWNFSFVNLS